MAAAKPTVCDLCGQPLGDPQIVTRYERNLKAQENRLRQEAGVRVRKELEAEYAAKESASLTDLAAKAEDRAEKKFDKRTRQLERNAKGLQEQLDIANRRLERLSSADRGAFNEDELLAALKRQFSEDRIERVKRGPVGRTDILHDVRYGGQAGASAGFIVYECKDTIHWDNDFLKQVKASKEFHRASHAVLVSRAFPSKFKTFAVIEDVAIVDPLCMLSIAQVLRAALIEVAKSSLTVQNQRRKTDELYRYLASEDFRNALISLREATAKVQESLLKEKRDHDSTWAQRELWYRRIDSGMTKIQETIAGIIERPAVEGVIAAEPSVIADLPSPPALH